MACIFFSISSGKLEIVKVLFKTRIRDKLEAVWKFRAHANDPPSPRRNKTIEEITR